MKQICWNEGWQFAKPGEDFAPVDLPHTWNGADGQDGGDDYFRGTCRYRKTLDRAQLPACDAVYLQFEGANSSAEVFVDGKRAARHDGGYATWRVNLTGLLPAAGTAALIEVAVDNAPNDHVYPQKADFTFYGGLYRTVSLLCVGAARFDLDYYGTPGVKVTPVVTGADAEVTAEAFLTGAAAAHTLRWAVTDGGAAVCEQTTPAAQTTAVFRILDAHLWNGRKDPHLYTLTVQLCDGKTVLDERTVRFGCRSFAVDPEKGFILNGQPYPLRGVARHQDRPKKGNALTRADHEEDMDLICEIGATTIRLAHYQNDQYFYDLCDERGLVIWAEIPYISLHLENGVDNTLQQMRELIVQNYNHPCIVVWGLSNEITMGGAADASLLENHRALNALCHQLDPTRKTTLAVVTMCSMDEEYVHIPDVVAYNHYYGWYGGTTDQNGRFMDEFHRKYPDTPIGMSEYGCEALNWHTSDPVQGDYTEEYQALYHEELIKQLYTRPYIWGTWAWNMFDFAADARSEGGEDGMNHKGLVTFDRGYKKDAFYAYKAWLSDEPFVHICGKRYVDRVEDVTKVTVYSNQPQVELFANGVSLGVQTAEDHFFKFEVPNAGETMLAAKAGPCADESRIRKVETFNEAYRMKESGDVLNWFEIETPEGYFSINDKIGDIMATKKGSRAFKCILLGIAWRHRKQMLALVKSQKASQKKAGKKPAGKKRGGKASAAGGIMELAAGFTVKRALSMIAIMGPAIYIGKDEMLKINRRLNRVKK